eukprot:gb/GECG01003103.1/.p1 GENE.gb/GECG01003103.1/~~gb/GECG01003103.1/.p1  ORF type:complete len:128 (+),score=9.18 gb/GECG01003103.1/:1-384(+)
MHKYNYKQLYIILETLLLEYRWKKWLNFGTDAQRKRDRELLRPTIRHYVGSSSLSSTVLNLRFRYWERVPTCTPASYDFVSEQWSSLFSLSDVAESTPILKSSSWLRTSSGLFRMKTSLPSVSALVD